MFFLLFLVFLWIFKVFLSLSCVLILKFLSLVFLDVFSPKFLKIRNIGSKTFKSCVFCIFFSFIIKFKIQKNIYFLTNFELHFSKILYKNSNFNFKIFPISFIHFVFIFYFIKINFYKINNINIHIISFIPSWN